MAAFDKFLLAEELAQAAWELVAPEDVPSEVRDRFGDKYLVRPSEALVEKFRKSILHVYQARDIQADLEYMSTSFDDE